MEERERHSSLMCTLLAERCAGGLKEGVRFPGAGVSGDCEPSDGSVAN